MHAKHAVHTDDEATTDELLHPTPVHRASTPPRPRWRPSTRPDLSTGWRGVYAACEVGV